MLFSSATASFGLSNPRLDQVHPAQRAPTDALFSRQSGGDRDSGSSVDGAFKQVGAFYRRLFLEHGVVDLALNQARKLLYEGADAEWSTPVLYIGYALIN